MCICRPGRQEKSLPAKYLAGGLLALCLPLYFLYAPLLLPGHHAPRRRGTVPARHAEPSPRRRHGPGQQPRTDRRVPRHGVRGAPRAPGSPEGKIHSQHPIGLSVALLPAYWWGLDQWNNPRLAAALFISVLASLCAPLLFLYLGAAGRRTLGGHAGHLHHGRHRSLLPLHEPAVSRSSGPVHPSGRRYWPSGTGRRRGGSYRSWGPWEVPLLGLLALLLCGLPFLHPSPRSNWTPMRGRRAAPGLAQPPAGPWPSALSAWSWPRVCTPLVSFHFAFSGDWMGPLRPGSGAWGEGALGIDNWSISLPGQWLQVEMGPSERLSRLFLLPCGHRHPRKMPRPAIGRRSVFLRRHGRL